MALSRFWLKKRKRGSFPKVTKKNIKVDDETIKQIKNLINIFSTVQKTLGNEYYDDSEYMSQCNNTLTFLKDTLKIVEQNKKIEKDKEDTKTEFDIWFNSRK